jgi:opacity protein-like surface antigen
MINVRAIFLGLACAAALGAAAHAADMPDNWNPGPYVRPAPRSFELLSGWYVRGDAGFRLNHISSLEAPVPVSKPKYPDSLGLTFGAGYKYQWFRADATLDYGSQVRMNANSSLASAVQPQYSVKLETISALANAYIDLGSWWGFTPYVGAGAGVSYLKGSDYVDTTLPTVVVKNSNSRTNFSWAAMAGVSYRINARFTVDLGYRHLDLGALPTTTGTNLSTDRTRWRGLSTDEVRLGLRFMLD